MALEHEVTDKRQGIVVQRGPDGQPAYYDGMGNDGCREMLPLGKDAHGNNIWVAKNPDRRSPSEKIAYDKAMGSSKMFDANGNQVPDTRPEWERAYEKRMMQMGRKKFLGNSDGGGSDAA